MAKSVILLALVLSWQASTTLAFQRTWLPAFAKSSFRTSATQQQEELSPLYASKKGPQVFASGYSPKLDLHEAIQEATEVALQALPKPTEDATIDLGFITVSSLYDGQSQPSIVVPAVLSSASVYGKGIQNLIGCTTGGIIASTANYDVSMDNVDDDTVQPRACTTLESEGVPGVSVTLALLPDVNVKVRMDSLV